MIIQKTFRIKTNRLSIYDIYFLCIILFMFISAICRIVDRQETEAGITGHLYYYTLYLLFLLSFAFLILKLKSADFLVLSVVFYLIYETVVTVIALGLDLSIFKRMISEGYTWPLVFLSVYICFRYYYYHERFPSSFKWLVLFGTCLCIVLMIPNISQHLIDYGNYGSAIGPIYYFPAFLPFVYVFCKRKTSIVLTVIIAAMILVSTKRGAFLIIATGLLLYFLTKVKIQGSKKLRRRGLLLLILGIVLLILICLWGMSRFDLQTFDRLMNSTEDGGSGRLDIWTRLLWVFSHSSIEKQLFGHGFHMVPVDITFPMWGRAVPAHCSYLEVLYDMGIVGLILLLIILAYLVLCLKDMINHKFLFSPALSYSLSFLLVLATIGIFFERSVASLPVCIIWGMCMGIYNNKRIKADLSIDYRILTHS